LSEESEETMATIHVSLTEAQKEFIDAQIAESGHASADAYIQELLREAQKRKAWANVETLVLEGLESGPPIHVTAEFWDERRRALRDKYPEVNP
jgi:antitoxin ParD1/3/4